MNDDFTDDAWPHEAPPEYPFPSAEELEDDGFAPIDFDLDAPIPFELA